MAYQVSLSADLLVAKSKAGKDDDMKVGVNAFAWTANFDRSKFDLLPAIREHGLDGFEVPVFDPSKVDTSAIRRALEANRLECTVCAILPSGINPISPDAAVRKKTLVHLVNCVEVAAELGAKLIGGPVFAPVGYLPGRRRNQDEWKWAVECFQTLGGILDSYAITLALEPLNRFETFFLTTAADAKALCDAVGHLRIGVLVDTFHSNVEEKNIAQALRSLGPRLKHIHASENDRGIPGTGHVDFAGIVAALREIRYDGYLMIEGFGFSPEEANSPVVIWRNLEASPEAIAFEGASFFRNLLGDSASQQN
jgi:D-psicose/D-tagatose/L-ribulose 3-epimerase